MAAFVYFLLLASEFRSSSVDITVISAFTKRSLDYRSFKHVFNGILLFCDIWMIIAALAVLANVNCVYASLAMNVN